MRTEPSAKCSACGHPGSDHVGFGGMCRWKSLNDQLACKCGYFHYSDSTTHAAA